MASGSIRISRTRACVRGLAAAETRSVSSAAAVVVSSASSIIVVAVWGHHPRGSSKKAPGGYVYERGGRGARAPDFAASAEFLAFPGAPGTAGGAGAGARHPPTWTSLRRPVLPRQPAASDHAPLANPSGRFDNY